MVWKPSETKTHLRPEVDPCGEGDWGTNWGFHGKNLKGASQGCSLSCPDSSGPLSAALLPKAWASTDRLTSPRSLWEHLSLPQGCLQGREVSRLWHLSGQKRRAAKKIRRGSKRPCFWPQSLLQSNAQHAKVPARSYVRPAGQEHQRINLDTNSHWLLAP